MEFLLNRYRNLTVLLVVIVAQLILIAYQVKTNKDVPLIRVWAITAVTPVERILEVVRRNSWVFVEDYFVLLHTRSENQKLHAEVGRLKLENQYLKTELSTADRARALSVFQAQAPSKTVAARIIGNGTGANSKVVFVDRGSGNGIEAGMAVVTPDGIVGKVVASYPTASLVLLMTDANFAAGVISQKNHVHGTLKGQGHDGTVMVDYVQNEEHVDPGEWFYTSGDDRVFPKGFPVGQVAAVRNGRLAKEIYVMPSGFLNGLEEVLIVLAAVHQNIPDSEMASPGYKLLPAPPTTEAAASGSAPKPSGPGTEADRLKDQYRQFGVAEKHTYGEGGFDKPPDFTKLGSLRTGDTKPDTTVPGKPASGAPGAAAALNGAPPAAVVPPTPLKPKQTPELANGKPPATGDAARTVSSPPTATVVPPTLAAKPKPRTSGPLLVTDPTDADPSEAQPPPSSSRPERATHTRDAELSEPGAPKRQKTSVTRARAVDENTEVLPDAAPPQQKAKSPVTTGATGVIGTPGNIVPKARPASPRQ